MAIHAVMSPDVAIARSGYNMQVRAVEDRRENCRERPVARG